MFNTAFETTSKVIAARRLKILRDICEQAMLAPSLQLFGKTLLEVFASDTACYESPFVALYTCTAVSSGGDGGGGESEERTSAGGSSTVVPASSRDRSRPRTPSAPASASASSPASATASDFGHRDRDAEALITTTSSHKTPSSNKTSASSKGSGKDTPASRRKGREAAVPFRMVLTGSLGIPEQPEGASHPMFARDFVTKFGAGGAAASSVRSEDTSSHVRVEQTTSQNTAATQVDDAEKSRVGLGLGLDEEMQNLRLDPAESASHFNSLPPGPLATATTEAAVTIETGDPSAGSTSSNRSTPSGGSDTVILDDGTVTVAGLSPVATSPSTTQNLPPNTSSTNSTGAPASFDWAPYIAEAMRTCSPVLVPNLPSSLMADVGVDRGWKDLVREAVVIPITAECDSSTSSASAAAEAAVLILGVNSRRPYNAIYASWIDVMRMTLDSSLNAVLGREAETRRADQLAQLDAAKTAFFSNASHELRTPLTLIGGPLNEALAVAEDKRMKDRLSLASRNVARLSRLVDSLMDFSRVRLFVFWHRGMLTLNCI